MRRPGRFLLVRLEGGADALNVVVPHGDDGYRRARPTIGLAKGAVHDLDGVFGLHPAMAALANRYRDGEAAVVVAAGLAGGGHHSHFEAWDEMDAGAPGEGRPRTGWLARLLVARSPGGPAPLRALALGDGPPRVLAGALAASSAGSLSDLALPGTAAERASLRDALTRLWSASELPFASRSGAAFETLRAVESVRESLAARPRAGFPETPFGTRLSELAALFETDIGLEAGVVSLGGFDTHILEGGATGLLSSRLGELSRGLDAFARALKGLWKTTVVAVISEFGRRVAENGSAGTDHGRGGAALVLGGSVRGGRVAGSWPGLGAAVLADPGDLPVTTDVRDVLAAALGLEPPERALVFPGTSATALDFLGNAA